MPGSTAVKPPVRIAIDEKFAKPHSANDTIAIVFGASTGKPAATTCAASFR
ncbi:hypothetical protein DO65_6451 [Burkholderia pseudomallei]|nr:hypothetical protein DO65_6451 [Burkholderia pseudomallei]